MRDPGTGELGELRAYLGPDYDELRLRGSRREVEEEYRRAGDELTLYRTSEAYLYDLTAFAMSGTKAPYLDVVRRFAAAGAPILDYGCGIGSDGLALLSEGYRVAFADFANPSTRYLRWRLEQRALQAPVYDLERDVIPTGFELAYAFDVIEHVEDPFGFLRTLETHARLVLVNFLEPEPDETVVHRALPIERLIRHAAGHDLRFYRRFHSRSHLVLYGRRSNLRPRARIRSRGVLERGRARAALEDARRRIPVGRA
jgi:hypothetical protein